MEINELEIYAKKYPNISIEELIENIKKERNQTLEDDDIRRENEEKWFNDLIGKYILVDFKGGSYLVFHCNKSILKSFYDVKFDCFTIYRSSKGFELSKQKRTINYSWFNCPYTNQIGSSDTKIAIITEEKYNQITEIYNTMKSQLKEWFSTK